MRMFLLGLVFGLVLGWGGFWYYGEGGRSRNLKEDVAHSTQAVEDKARKAGAAIADAATNARITAAIKAKLTADLGVSALADISVDTTDGLVTLSGSVSSKDDISKAVRIASDTEGVHKVISTLQVKAK